MVLKVRKMSRHFWPQNLKTERRFWTHIIYARTILKSFLVIKIKTKVRTKTNRPLQKFITEKLYAQS